MLSTILPGVFPSAHTLPALVHPVVLQFKQSTHRITSTSLVCSIPHLTDPWPPIPTASVQPTHTFPPLTPSLPHSLRCSYCTPFYSCCLCTQTILFPNYNALHAPTAWIAMISSSPSWSGVLHSPSDSILPSLLFPSRVYPVSPIFQLPLVHPAFSSPHTYYSSISWPPAHSGPPFLVSLHLPVLSVPQLAVAKISNGYNGIDLTIVYLLCNNFQWIQWTQLASSRYILFYARHLV